MDVTLIIQAKAGAVADGAVADRAVADAQAIDAVGKLDSDIRSTSPLLTVVTWGHGHRAN